MIQVLIADDHPLIRKGIKQLLSETSNIIVTSETDKPAELIELISSKHYDLILLDINLPGKSGLDALQDIRRIKPELPVLILSIYEDEDYIIKSIERGANGYISKTSDPKILISAIEKVAEGGYYISDNLASKLLYKSKTDSFTSSYKILTAREIEILKKITEGKTPKTIANDLIISVKTVNSHRINILRKLKLNSNADLIKYSLKNEIP